MSIKQTLLTGLLALCLGVSSLVAADGIYVKQDPTGKEMGELLVIFTGFGGIVEVSTYRNKEDLRETMAV
ncbi:MAG: hypothetical protein ACI3XC_06350, partial [Phascolarctobacterium sp.]